MRSVSSGFDAVLNAISLCGVLTMTWSLAALARGNALTKFCCVCVRFMNEVLLHVLSVLFFVRLSHSTALNNVEGF